jgi:hypothetical protein
MELLSLLDMTALLRLLQLLLAPLLLPLLLPLLQLRHRWQHFSFDNSCK